MLKKLLSLSLLAIASLSAKAAYVPVNLTGFTTDIVANGPGPASGSTSASNLGSYDFMAPDFNPAGTTPTSYLPASGIINSASTPGLSFQLQSYSTNNAIYIAGVGTDSLVFATPVSAGEVDVLNTSADGASTVTMIVNFTDGTSQTFSAQSVSDWYNGSNYAIQGLGRVNLPGATTASIGNDASNPRLYENKLVLSSTNYAKQIRSVVFSKTSTGSEYVVMAISISTLCNSTPVAGTTASSLPTVCSGISFVVSLPNANAGVGSTYQWQSSATGAAGSWTNITGATNASYTATQTATTYYRAYITCSGGTSTDTSSSLSVGMTPAAQCYCIPSAASTNYYISNFTTTGALTNVNNTSGAGVTSSGYSNFTSQPVSAAVGSTVNFSIAHGSSSSYTFGSKIYVDWNQNGIFTDAGETMFASSGYASTFTGSFTVPSGALTGNTRMRVISDYYTGTGPAPCAFSTTGPYGEAEDYTFSVVSATACSGTPNGGTATSSVSAVCSGTSFNLSATGYSVATGISYQWQVSTNSGASWTAISGATSIGYTASQTAASMYRLKVTCGTTDSAFSAAASVALTPATQCYCIPVATSTNYYISNFTTTGAISNVNNTTGSGITTTGYSDYTSQTVSALVGGTLNFSVAHGSSSTYTFGNKIFVDWNQNGSYADAGETMFTSSGYATTFSGSFAVPSGALTGTTRMRVMSDYYSGSGPATPCAYSTTGPYGEAEDYTFVVVPSSPCAAPTAQPTSLVLTPAVSSVSGSFTASSPVADKYLVLRTPGTATPTVTPVNTTVYTVGATLGNATVVSAGTNATSFTDAALLPVTQYRYTIYAYNDICSGGPVYNTTSPLSATTTTVATGTYTWNGSVSKDWQIAGNWTPSRNTPDPSDILLFNNAVVDSVINIPTQTINRLAISNNTIVTFKAKTASASTLTFASDNSAATNELDIAAGSSLIVNGTATPLTLAFSGTGGTGRIAGLLEMVAGNALNTVNFTNATDTVTATGTLAAGGINTASSIISTAANLVINGTYNHKYTSVGGNNIPTATWGNTSGVLVSGYTTSTSGPATGLGQAFNNFTYNCPLQTSNCQWAGILPTSISGTLSVGATGTGQWQWATTTAYTATVNNYTQTGGIVDLGTSTGSKTLNVSGGFTQTGGLMKVSGAGVVTLNFNGTAAVQNASFSDSSITGPVVYRVTNPNGINLTGTGYLATNPAFKINSTGGVQITSAAAAPINTALALTYAATGTTLTYDGAAAQTGTAAVWPATNGPLNLTINNTGTAPANRVTMPGNRSVNGTVTITNGLLVLGGSNLAVTNNATGAISISSPSATKMIVADGAGQLQRSIGTTASSAYLFPVGDVTATVEYSPVNINFVTNAGNRLMGVRVVNAHNPNDASATNYLNRYWVFTDTATTAYTYNGSFTYTTADIVGTESSIRLSEWNNTVWSQIPSLPASNVLTIANIQSSANFPLGGMQITGRPAAASNIYTWNGSISTDYQVAGNWTPVRNVPDPGDILQFNNAIVDTVKNVPTQTVTKLSFTNNTTAVFQTAATNTLTLLSDNSTATNELDIAAGSNLTVNSPSSALTIAFAGTGGTANISGTLESISNTVNNIFNFTNAVATVASTGTLAEGGSNSSSAVTGTTATNLQVNGLFNYKYTTNTVGLPLAAWNTGSTLLISGYTTVTGGPSGNQNQTFYNFTYNCPNQTSTANWSGTGALTVLNNFTVASTGTGTWQYATTQAYNAQVGNFIQTGGTFDIEGGSPSSATAQVFNVSGSFTKTGGTFKASGTSANSLPVVNFNGTTAQNVTFDASPAGQITYRVSNGAGINLLGASGLATFNVNNNGGIRISSAAANPINTTLAIAYGTTNTTLTYDTTASYAMTASVFPVAAGPQNLAINTGSSINVVSMPFSRTIPGVLTMTSGDIDITSNTLTLGTTAAAPGTLTYTAGNIRLTTGSFVRWYGTSGLPTATGTGIGFYPVAYGGANRNVALYFSTATGLSTGGSIGVGHINAGGFTTGLSVADGAYTINTRTNSSWGFTTSGIVLNGTATIGMKLTGTGLLTSNNPANLRVMQANAVVGTHVAGAGVSAQRSGMVVADLSSAYYIGAATVDINGAYIAINTGNWSTPATWQNNLVPGITNDAFINPGVVVTADAVTDSAKSLYIFPGGTLTVNSNAVTIDSAVLNAGIINVGGGTLNVRGNTGASGITSNFGANFNLSSGTVNLGPTGGSNKPFVVNGTLSVSGGTLNINGNMLTNAGSVFNQSGGNINVDGNAGSNAANSVASGTVIVSFQSQNLNLTGGNFTIVDPHPNATSTRTFEYNTTAGNVNLPATHTFIFGNGTSTDTTANSTNGFRINAAFTTSRMGFGNVIINGTNATNRFVSPGNAVGILGSLTINNGGEYRTAGSALYVNGNLTVNTGGILTDDNTLNFASYANGTAAGATAAQTVSGGGTFRNAVSATPSANFSSITARNSNGVTFNIGSLVSFSGTTTFAAGTSGPSVVRMMPNSTGILYEISGAGQSGAGQTTGWLWGRYQKAAGSTGGFNGTFPVGDSLYYAFVNIGTATVTTTGAIWIGTTPGDHPNLGSSTINTTKSVNRYWTVTPVNGLVLSPTFTGTFNWNAADVDAGSVTSNFKVGNYISSAWAYPTIGTQAATSIQMSGTAIPLVSGDYAVGEGCSAINITAQPATQTICAGSPVTFNVGLSGTVGITYQWMKGSTAITGATNSSYTIPSTTATDAGTYSVVLTSACATISTVTSATAQLTINIAPAITTQPVAQTICEGSPVTFTTAATGTGTLTYQWMKGGSPVSGATNASYTINVVAPGDAGNYTVVVTGASPCANAVSNAATLIVNPLPLTITAAGSTSFCAGGSVTLNASTTSGLTYQWKLGGNPISGATNAAYIATAGGSYTATITNTANGCSNTSNTITITNATPVATITPAATAAYCQGGTVTLTGPATAGVTYQWNLGGNPISGATNQTYAAGTAGNYTLSVSTSPTCTGVSAITAVSANPLPVATATAAGPTTFCQGGTVLINGPAGTGVSYQWRNNGAPVSGATNSSYTASASGNYKIVVTNTTTGCMDSSAAVAVTVNPLPTATITAASATSFCIGGSVVLNANTGTGLTYQWSVGGNPITGATTATYTASTSGSYTVTVTNTSTTCVKTSTATTVTVNPLPNVTATAAGPTTFCQGGSVVISVPPATGQTYQWKQAGNTIGGATNASYTVTASGSYTVLVTNTSTTCNATSTAIVVTVNPLPAATITPAAAQTICQGDSVTYNANTGTGLAYQWKLGGNTITGATNATFVAYAPGAYTVTVTNTATTCNATSAAANLTVNPRPIATISYTTPITFCDGGAVVLSGNSGTGYTYQWQQNGTPIAGATGIDNIVSSTGLYSVVVTNSFGCSSAVSQPVSVTVNPLPVPVITRNNSVLSTGSFSTYQWFLNNNPVSGGTSQSIVITQNGGYAVQVTDANGCTSRSPIMFVNNVGINTPGIAGSDVKIYPNPAHQVVYIDAPVKVNVAIRDLTGKLILVQDNVKEIDLGGFADGVYMIMVSDQHGRLIKTEKLFKSE